MSKNILRYIKILTLLLTINMIICLIIWIIRNDMSFESLSNIFFYSSGVFAIVTYLSSKGNLNLGISDRYYSYIASVKKNKEERR
ncbi:hypothetical protein [uncultured Clostridium sp.]|uniref:hypothetical protein n=1 Tax=uncultured Clostridium sp. TaxID=59620 RepID=UPI0028E5DB9C|nr:hypothetical protein [uncultured Clostridium sp.]